MMDIDKQNNIQEQNNSKPNKKGRRTLISLGRQAFKVLIRCGELDSKQISKELGCKIQRVSNIKQELRNAGWLEGNDITPAGQYFLETIYKNNKIKDKLND